MLQKFTVYRWHAGCDLLRMAFMKMQLEWICTAVDSILAIHGLTAKVAGGRIARDELLLSLSDTIFIDTCVQYHIQQALKARRVAATVGGVFINEGINPMVIEGEYELLKPVQGETIDLIDLIAEYQSTCL